MDGEALAGSARPRSPARPALPELDSFASSRSERSQLDSFAHPPLSHDLRGRLDYVDGFRRLQSVSFLLVGSVSGLLGFAFAGFLGIYKYKHEPQAGVSFRGDGFESGRNFHPATVSEMVRDPASPEGKVFFAFCTLSAICILVSAYPWSLRNVYIGHDHARRRCRLCCNRLADERPVWVSLVSLRQFVPPMGLMMVVGITVTSGPRSFCESVAASLHTLGAVMMLAPYIGFEFHALWFSQKLVLVGAERRLRKWLAVLALASALGFEVLGLVMGQCESSCRKPGKNCSCGKSVKPLQLCTDIWRTPTIEDIAYSKNHSHMGAWVRQVQANEINKKLLANTASGWFLTLKIANYWAEVFAGLSVLASHLVIWYYCPERNLALSDQLPDIQGQYQNMDQDLSRSAAT